MPDQDRTTDELRAEIARLRRRLARFEAESSSPSRDPTPDPDLQDLTVCRSVPRASYAENVLDAMPDVICVTDLAGQLCYANRRFQTIVAMSAEELIGKTFSETGLFDPEQFVALHQRVMPQLLVEETLREVETLVLSPDGSPSTVFVDLALLRDEAGEPSHIAVVVPSAAGLRKAERALVESERRYREIVETVADVIVTVDMGGRVRSVNPAVKKLLGLDPDEVIGRPLADFIPRENRASIVSQIESVLSGQSVRSEVVLFDRENRPVHVEYSASPLVEDGRIVGGRSVAWDITERKLLERELQASEERYRLLVEGAGEAIATVDEGGVFRFMNHTAARRLGGHPADFVGRTMWDLFPPDIADRQFTTIREVLRSGQGSNTVSLSYVGGQMRWYDTTVQALCDGDGRTTAGLVIARDIHEFKKAQDELAAYSERISRAEQLASLGTLSATLSHELTQPLTVIRLSIQNCLEDLQTTSCPERVIEDLKDALAEIASVAAIAERFRSFARRSSEKVARDICIHDIAAKVLRLLQESARRADIAMATHGLDALPPVCMYGRDLEQLIFALAQNAVQAADGKRTRRFTIEGHHAGDHIELHFVDDCGGIAPENLERVFEPFFTTKPPGEGTGLGLCVAQRVVSQRHGHMSVESEFGRGTTFRVWLPVRAEGV